MRIYFAIQSTFMHDQLAPLNTLNDIRKIMERSGRFISLSGLSGISAGCCALAGAWFARQEIGQLPFTHERAGSFELYPEMVKALQTKLIIIAVITFLAAFLLAFLFTFIRSRKNAQPVWTTTSRRLLWNVLLPIVAGGLFLLQLIRHEIYGFVAPGCLLFYGMALINGGKYTLSEIRYLGYAMIVLGLLNSFLIGNGLLFWTLGFGILHILYGAIMWFKYERGQS
jgi:hypothetical protein